MINAILISLAFLIGPTDQYGKSHDLNEPGAGYTVVDFTAGWCQPCWRALPHLEAFARQNPQVKVVVISVDNHKQGRDMLVKKLGLTVPVVWDEGHVLAQKFNPPGMPTTLILDKDGKVVYQHVGYSEKLWREFTEKMLSLK